MDEREQSNELAVAITTQIIVESEVLRFDWASILSTLESVVVMTVATLAAAEAKKGHEADFCRQCIKVLSERVGERTEEFFKEENQ